MSKDKKEVKVVEVKKRYISDAIRVVFTSKRKGRDANLVDAVYSIADSIRGLHDELKKMNAASDDEENIRNVNPAEDTLLEDRV